MALPCPLRVVAQDYLLAFVTNEQQRFRPGCPVEAEDRGMEFAVAPDVVIAVDEKLAAVQAAEDEADTVGVVQTHSEVAEVIDNIGLADDGVPALDHGLVVLGDRRERPRLHGEDVGVTEVRVGKIELLGEGHGGLQE